MYEQQKAAPGGYPDAAQAKTVQQNYPQKDHRAQPVRLPPYAKNLRPRADRSLIVVVGRRGWDLFQRQGQGIDYGILLPTADPSQLRFPNLSGWPDALIVDVDNTLTAGEEREIARALLAAGCPYIVGRWTSYARRAQA